MEDNDANEACTTKFLNITKMIIPNKMVTICVSDKSWYNGYVHRLNWQKQKLFKQCKQINSQHKVGTNSDKRGYYVIRKF